MPAPTTYPNQDEERLKQRNDCGGRDRIGTWIVRSLNRKDPELIEETKKYGLGVLGASETKGKGCGAKEIEDCYVVYLGVRDGRARVGVVVFLSEEMSRYVKSCLCGSERIVVVRLKIGREWITYVQVYAPTDDGSKKVKDGFYNGLQGVLDKTVKRDAVLVMGKSGEK